LCGLSLGHGYFIATSHISTWKLSPQFGFKRLTTDYATGVRAKPHSSHSITGATGNMMREPISITITTNATTTDQSSLVTLINAAYKVGEAGIITNTKDQPFNRVNTKNVADMVAAGQLLVARINEGDGCRIVGCIKAVPDVDNSVGEWGCLAVATEEQGKGVGSRLIDAAEEALRVAGCQTAQLELLAPVGWDQEHKKRLRVYYTERRGYALKTGLFATSTTSLEAGTCLFGEITLATDASFTIYTRALV